MWAVGGAILETMHNKLADLTFRPDAVILYIGHNEFQGRFAWMRDVDYYVDQDRALLLPTPSILGRASLLRFSPLCQLIMETRERQRLDIIPPRQVTRQLVDEPACTAAEAAAVVADFRRRLEEIASYCETIRTLPIFIIPPSNDGGYDPNRSVLAPETPESDRAAFARAVARAHPGRNRPCRGCSCQPQADREPSRVRRNSLPSGSAAGTNGLLVRGTGTLHSGARA